MPWDEFPPGCVGVVALQARGGEFTSTRSGFIPGTSHAWMCKAYATSLCCCLIFCAPSRDRVRVANPRIGFKLTLHIV